LQIDTTAAVNDVTSPGCGGSGPDEVFTFTTNMAQQVTAQIQPDNMSASWDPVVSIRKLCADNTQGNEVVCKEVGGGQLTTATVKNLAAGTYFLWVDGYGGTKGSGTLTVTLAPPVLPPANDNCGAPKMVALGSNTMGDTTDATADMGAMISLVCDKNNSGDFPGPDLVYSYTALANGMVTVTLTSNGSWDPALWIAPTMCTANGSNCTQASDAIGNMAPEKLTINAVMGTTYYIVVDSYSALEGGPFTLAVQ
jgi:hypothetical protein